jgi:hypothetical protein
VLLTNCAEQVSADVEESAVEIRITNVRGDRIEGADCLGSFPLDLGEPIADRAVIVDGERWVVLDADCPWGQIGPPDLGNRLETCGVAE